MEKLYTVSLKKKKKNWNRLVHIMSFFLQKIEIEENRKNHKAIQKWPKSNPLRSYSRSDE